MNNALTRAHQAQTAMSRAKDASILSALPATRKQLRSALEMPQSTVEHHVHMLLMAGTIVASGKQGREDVLQVAGVVIPMTKVAKAGKVQAPITAHHTQWIGGRYPGARNNPFERVAA